MERWEWIYVAEAKLVTDASKFDMAKESIMLLMNGFQNIESESPDFRRRMP